MSREIKFRAWDTYNETMIYSSEEDAIFILEEGGWSVKFIREKNMVVEGIEVDAPVWHESDEIELMQSTGLKDKNGKEIYEGDIINGRGGEEMHGLREYDITGIIEYSNSACFDIVTKDKTHYSFAYCDFDDTQVIGNIYENKDLLK